VAVDSRDGYRSHQIRRTTIMNPDDGMAGRVFPTLFGFSPVHQWHATRITCPSSVDSAGTVGLTPAPLPDFRIVTLLFDHTTQGWGTNFWALLRYCAAICRLNTGHGCLISPFPMWAQPWIATLLTSGTNTGSEKTSHYRGAHKAHPIETHQLGNTEQGAGDCGAPH